MITLCWGAKGGSGTTVLAAMMSLSAVEPVVVVDLGGDVPGVLGLPRPDGPGVLDWLASTASVDRLRCLEVRVSDTVSVLPAGSTTNPPVERWPALADALRSESRRVVIDAGTGCPPADLHRVADRRLLVTRGCYLALVAATRHPLRPDGVVLIEEAGRRLGAGEVAAALGVPVATTLLADPAVARAVDAGILTARLPRAALRCLRDLG